jgi:uncharacterized protein with von Willebrand factor type A (vWA) domain
MPYFLDNVLIFTRLLRDAGVDVRPGRVSELVAALQYVNLAARDEVRDACRAVLTYRHEHLAIFDRVFDAFWQAHHDSREPDTQKRSDKKADSGVALETILLEELVLTSSDAPDGEPASRLGMKIWSDRGGLATKEFASLTPEEVREARIALSSLVWNAGERRTRRWMRGHGARIDLRRAIADSLRTGGDLAKLPGKARRTRPRPLVLLCDVSGSMEHYSRMLLYFAHTLAARQRRVEAFLFSTRLTRITRELRTRHPEAALTAASQRAADWSGGTRIGATIKEFHQRWARRTLGGGAVVLLISDGWDRGDPDELRNQIARLQRRCHRLIWLNPLIGTADYAPLTRGLQAALPFVDDFLPSRTLANLADLAVHLNALTRVNSNRTVRARASMRGR